MDGPVARNIKGTSGKMALCCFFLGFDVFVLVFDIIFLVFDDKLFPAFNVPTVW